VPLIVVAPTTASTPTTPKSLSTPAAAALGTVGFGLRFIDLQSASAQFLPVQSRHGLIGFRGIGHFHKPESPGAASLPISHDAHFFHRSVSFENRAQFRFGSAMRQITYIQIFHYSSSLRKSSKIRAARLNSLNAKSRLQANPMSMLRPRYAQATVGFFSEADAFAAVFAGGAVWLNNSRFRILRASFCFRTRLNLDLSPFTPDMMDSCHSGRFANRETAGTILCETAGRLNQTNFISSLHQKSTP
jgi:hypothetical protein